MALRCFQLARAFALPIAFSSITFGGSAGAVGGSGVGGTALRCFRMTRTFGVCRTFAPFTFGGGGPTSQSDFCVHADFSIRPAVTTEVRMYPRSTVDVSITPS